MVLQTQPYISSESVNFNNLYSIYYPYNKLTPTMYRSTNCDTNLTANTPADQYQRLKIIQNTVRVPSSMYTMNLGSLNAYVMPGSNTYNVCWNQMSDRPIPSVQSVVVPRSGGINSKFSSVTGPRPGSQSPGGIGCDIKHNSYQRYLNRIKGKGPLRQGVIPANFGESSIPFSWGNPIYGAKLFKTNIITGCNCPII